MRTTTLVLAALALLGGLQACGKESDSSATRRTKEFEALRQEVAEIEREYFKLDCALQSTRVEVPAAGPERLEKWFRSSGQADRRIESLLQLTLRDEDLAELRPLRDDLRKQLELIREPARALARDWMFVDVHKGQAVHSDCGGFVRYGSPCTACSQIGNPGYSCCPKLSPGRDVVCERCALRRPRAAIGVIAD